MPARKKPRAEKIPQSMPRKIRRRRKSKLRKKNAKKMKSLQKLPLPFYLQNARHLAKRHCETRSYRNLNKLANGIEADEL